MTNNVGFAQWMSIVIVFVANQISLGLNGEVVDLCYNSRTNVKIPICNKLFSCGENKRLILKAKVIDFTETCDKSGCGYRLLKCCYKELLSMVSGTSASSKICDLTICHSPINITQRVQDIARRYNVTRISYDCEENAANIEEKIEDEGRDQGDKDKLEREDNEDAEKDGFPVAGYAAIGLVLALLIVIVTIVMVIWRRKKRRSESEGDTLGTTARTNKAYETTDNSNEQKNTYETLENPFAEVYSEIGDTCISRGMMGDGGETNEYNKLNLRFLPMHNDPTYGFDSASANTNESHSNTNENVLAKTDDTYNHLTSATGPRTAPSGCEDNTYNTLHVTGADTNTADPGKAKIDTYSHISSEANGEGFRPLTGEKEAATEGPDHDYFVLEHQNQTTTDSETVSQNNDYFTLEKMQ